MSSFLQYSQADTGPDPQVSVIWMHGLGDHGSSFVPLVKEFDLSGCPPIRFIFPHAPERNITANGGYFMRAWFDIYAGFEDSDMEDSEGIIESRDQIIMLIEQEKRRGVPADKIFLAGFSQGCAMALYTGLCYPEKLACPVTCHSCILSPTTGIRPTRTPRFSWLMEHRMKSFRSHAPKIP